MNQINNEKNNQQFDYETQREYATKGQLDYELKEEQEDNLLAETLEASVVTDALEKISIILGAATRLEAESHIEKKTEFTAEDFKIALSNLNKGVQFVSVVETAAEIKEVSA